MKVLQKSETPPLGEASDPVFHGALGQIPVPLLSEPRCRRQQLKVDRPVVAGSQRRPNLQPVQDAVGVV
jgi:hypothetical protein